jgi:PAS domain S-box-containing protein
VRRVADLFLVHYCIEFLPRETLMPETLRRRLWSSRVAAGSSVLIAALGLIVLIGWFSHNPLLIQLRPDLPPMTRNAAACFLLCGLALLTIVLKGPKWIAVACAGIVSVASVLTIAEYVFGINVGIDELLGPSYLVLRVSSPGRMAPVVAICFALGSIALLIGPNLLAKHAGLLLGLIGSMIGAAGIATSLAVLLGSSIAPEWSDVTHVAVHTAIGLWTFGCGVLALAWQLEADEASTPRWLPISVTLGVATSTLALWQALIADGYPPIAPIPAGLLVGGCLMAPVLGLTIYQTQRARTQREKLQANQDLLDLAQKSARAMAFDWYIQQETNLWSPEQEALYGLPPGSFDGTYRSWKKLIHAPDWPVVVKAIKHAQESGEVAAEFRVIWPDGSVHWLSTNGRMFFDDAGEPLRMVGFTSDVTRRKNIEEELRRSGAFLAQAQQLSRTGSFSWRVTADQINWSEELYRIYEFDPGITITLEVIRTRVHPEDLTLYEKMVEQARNGADDFEWQYRLLMPDQSIKYMHAVAHATRDPNGQLEYIAAVQDVTRRKLIEEEMRRSEAFLAEGQRLSTTGSFVWRPDSDDIVFSDELKRIFGFELGTPVTLERIVGCVHPDDLSLVAEKIAQARAGGGDHDYEIRLRMPDGSVKYLHTNARANRRPDGYLEFVGAMQDVTPRRLAEEALGKARSELAHATRIMSLGVLTASIAHEVNQPLSGIITNASTCVRMLDGDPPNVDGARETAKRTIRDGRRAADVITRLRALFSKKDAAFDLVDLNEATREVIALSRSELERNGVITRTELAHELPLVRGDRVQLQQVIVNLLRNGSDAMSTVDDRPHELLFRTEVDEDDRVRVSVQDSGVGLDPQTLDQLFQTFYTTKEEGMGIGLSVSRSIIENHHGRLWATSNDGPGVTFSFSIPCAVAR